MAPGALCTEALKAQVRKEIADRLSRSHVPDVVDECFEVPRTGNDKK